MSAGAIANPAASNAIAGSMASHTTALVTRIDRERTAGSIGRPGPGGGSTSGSKGGTGIQGRVLAGPTCPVVSVNDPSCNDRPVAGATIVVLDARGTEIARLVTDVNGNYAVALPAGPYTIEPQPVEGFMRVARPHPGHRRRRAIASVDINFRHRHSLTGQRNSRVPTGRGSMSAS